MQEVKIKKILITGGAGFIGYNLANELSLDENNRITLVDNLVRGRQDPDFESLIKKTNISFICGDLTEKSAFENLEKGYDEIYHLAAIIGVRNVIDRPHEVIRVNAMSTLLLLDWFVQGGGKKLLFSSTSEAYGWTKQFYDLPVPTPEDVPLSLTDLKNPRSSYAGSKIFGELAVNQYCLIHNKPFVIVRYHNVYGPRMGYEHVIPELYMRAKKGQNPLIVYSADHRRAFCYVSDAVDATILAIRSDKTNGKTINIGNDKEEIAIGELARLILKIAKINTDILPRRADNDPIKRRCPNTSLAKKLLGYEAKVTLENGLKKTLQWYSDKIK